MKRILNLFLFIIFAASGLRAQEKGELMEPQNNFQFENEQDWVPTLLHAGTHVLNNTILYNGRVFSWSLRGGSYSANYINGVNLVSPLGNYNNASLFSGLQQYFRKEETIVNGNASEMGYEKQAAVNYYSTEIANGNKKWTISNSIKNSIYSNHLSVHYNNGLGQNGLKQSIGFDLKYAAPGHLPIGFQKSFGLVYSIQKDFSNKSLAMFSVIWNVSSQSRASTSIKEVFDLTNNRSYNPNWGWYQNQYYFSSTRQTNAPLFSFTYQKNLSEKAYFKLGWALVVGRQSSTALEWTNTADPRPDYYRYLPSYIADTFMRSALTNWYQQHPELLQMQFDKFAQINTSSKNGRAFYIINQENKDLFLLHGSALYSRNIKSHVVLQFGVQYLADQIHYSNTLKDLLGGKYYYNYNSWINDDGTATSFQNDIAHPDRKIEAGEKWGPDYYLKAMQINPWLQLRQEGPKVESSFALGYGIQGLQRIGFNANGLFPQTSLGKSNLLLTPSWDFKLQYLYKISGRWYLRSILFGQWSMPDADATYINPAIQSIPSPYLLTTLDDGADIGVWYRTPIVKFAASVYWKNTMNESVRKMFYHDAYTSFVYGIAGNASKRYTGVETSFETDFIQKLQLSIVATLQQNIYANNLNYKMLSVNDLQLMESGILHTKSLPVSSSPNLASAFNFLYEPFYTTRLGLTVVYAKERPVALDVFRRSDVIKNKLDPYSWSKQLSPSFLQDQAVVNAFLSKSILVKSRHNKFFISAFLSVRNLFNTLVPVFAYEQSRFDYLHFDPKKYALKYMFDQGVTYSLKFQLQIQ